MLNAPLSACFTDMEHPVALALRCWLVARVCRTTVRERVGAVRHYLALPMP
jgi:hypothetical protein